MNNYEYFSKLLNPDDRYPVPDYSRARGYDTFIRSMHAIYERRNRILSKTEKRPLEGSFGDWLLHLADQAAIFEVGDVVRYDLAGGLLGVVVGYEILHMTDEEPIVYKVVFNSARGKIITEPQHLKRETIPQEIIDMVKAQLLDSCPDVCPLKN